jgi:hypothetical protein
MPIQKESNKKRKVARRSSGQVECRVRQQAETLACLALANTTMPHITFLLAKNAVANSIEPYLKALERFLVLGAAITLDGVLDNDKRKNRAMSKCIKSVKLFDGLSA